MQLGISVLPTVTIARRSACYWHHSKAVINPRTPKAPLQSGDKSPHSKESIPPPLVSGNAIELDLVVLILNLAPLIGSDVALL